MTTIQIQILNPKAKKLLLELEKLKLISIESNEPTDFLKLVTQLRSKVKKSPPSLEEITKEVELVRSARNGHKKG
jgi:hypothetical protein